MKTLVEAAKINGVTVPMHEIELLCPNCGRDVDEQELTAQSCNDCGFSLAEPQANVAIHVTTLPAVGGAVM